MDIDIEKYISEERKVLHDLSNQVLVASGMITLAIKTLDTNESVNDKELERITKAQDAVKSISTTIKDRRSQIYKIIGLEEA